MHLRSYVKYSLHCADFHETQNSSTKYCLNLLYRCFPKLNEKCRTIITFTEPIFTKLKISQKLSVDTSCTYFCPPPQKKDKNVENRALYE
jgi:hypothetical protein